MSHLKNSTPHKHLSSASSNSTSFSNSSIKNTTSTTSNTYTFYAKESIGSIGKLSPNDRENNLDNFFNISIPDSLYLPKYQIELVYDLYGLSEANQVTKSINRSPSYGGGSREFDKTWKTVKEYVPTSFIRNGNNEIFFNLREDSMYTYQIKNVRFKLSKQSTQHLSTAKKSFFQAIVADENLASNSFILNNKSTKSFIFNDALITNTSAIPQLPNKLTIYGLDFKNLRPLSQELINVTQGDYLGYRVKKSNKDSLSLHLSLGYDEDKIPEGYSPKDIKTYYFDNLQKVWKALPVIKLDYKNKKITSRILNNLDTDYINGVIKVPENPETSSFAPTAMSDIEITNPASGVVNISTPSANTNGTLSTSFPLKLPKGRNGLQPSLEVTYNSEGGNSWMGIGWNIHTPAVSLNTKWGAPLFNLSKETELYSLNGADLVLQHGGEYTNPHRADNHINRLTNRTFYLRKEGQYLRITRHGDSPKNYWWEVTDKYGNKSFYGGYNGSVINNAVLKNNQGNIAHWALFRQEDTYGNYIEYTYDQGNTVENNIMGKYFYLDYITYTRHASDGNNYYQVNFNRASSRPDITINGRNGLIEISKNLLDEIEVLLKKGSVTEKIRSYKFSYTESIFKKSLLSKIAEYDSQNKLFYSNSIEYYQDVGSNVISGNIKTWGGENDPISSPLHTIASSGFAHNIPKGSVLGTNVSSGFSAGLRAGAGLGVSINSTASTFGGSYNYSQNTQDARISFLDINGDGLPDKVYTNSSGVFYRPNTGSSFGSLIKINGINQLSKTKSRTHGWGIDVNALGLIGVGKSGSHTKSNTDNYFTDFNGDGLPDMVTGNRIKFNTTNTNSDYTWRAFENTPDNSENIIFSGNIAPVLIDDLELETLNELRDQHPQFDHVKVWQAPYTGNISINGIAELKLKNTCADNIAINNFRLTVERADRDQDQGNTQVISSENLNNQGDSITYNLTQYITKGELLFFRIHNKNYGCGGEIEWNPTIHYTSGFPNTLDENGKSFRNYNAQQDYIMNNGGNWIPNKNDVRVDYNFNLEDSNFSAYQFSDEIRFIIEKTRVLYNSDNEQIGPPQVSQHVRTYQPSTGNFIGTSNMHSNINVDPHTSGGDYYRYSFRCYAESDANVAWEAINWKPAITGYHSRTQYPAVNYLVYDDNVNEATYWWNADTFPVPNIIDSIPNDAQKPLLRLSHTMFTENYANHLNRLGDANTQTSPLKINWVVKEKTGSTSKVLYKKSFYMHRLAYSSSTGWSYKFTRTSNPSSTQINPSTNPADSIYAHYNLSKEKVDSLNTIGARIYTAFYVNNKKFASGNPANIIVGLHPDEQTNYSFSHMDLNAPFMANSPTFYGITYRGWGQFLYNGGIHMTYDQEGTLINTENFEGSIAMDVFNTDNEYTNQSDVDTLQNQLDETDPDNLNATTNKAIRYTLYEQDNQKKAYRNTTIINAFYGIDNNGDLISRLGRFAESDLYNIYVDPNDITAASNNVFFGFKQRSKSTGTAKSGNLASVNGTESESKTTVLNQYIDLNGDRYPDIVTKNKIQYSQMQGGLSDLIKNNSTFTTGSENQDFTSGISIASFSPNSNSDGSIKDIFNPIIMNTHAGINNANGKTFNTRQWIDINGDGLPDKVLINSTKILVQLNTGYGFSLPVIWGDGYQNLYSGSRKNLGAGAPLPGNSSISFGFGAGRGTSSLNAMLIDVNGDGLPDLVQKSEGNFIYHLNTGAKFESTGLLFSNGEIDKSTSLSGNVYGSSTFGFKVPLAFIVLKFVFSPSAGVNAAFDEKNISIQDIDGDGLPDVLKKQDGNGNAAIEAILNQTGKTHLLKKVNLPLGGSWTVDYKRVGNTYNMPQSKWVMKKLITHDGFTGDNHLDQANSQHLITFAYENGNYNRRERAFFGFEKVTTRQHNSLSENDIYRYSEQHYHNQNYYFKGTLKRTASYTANNSPLQQSHFFYNLQQPDVAFTAQNNTNIDNPYIASGIGNLDRTRALPVLTKRINTIFENNDALNAIEEFNAYDAYGNITLYKSLGSAEQAYQTSISYNNTSYRGLPTLIQVSANNTLLRKRTATYNQKGKLELITTHLNSNQTNSIQYTYNTLGNTSKITQLDNTGTAGPFEYTITYDNLVNTYPTSLNNSYNESTSTLYNYWFGIPVLYTDVTNNSMRTRIDNRGRVLEITSPKEHTYQYQHNNKDWTIRHQYPGEDPVATQIAGSGAQVYMIASAKGSFQAINPGNPQPTGKQHYSLTKHHIEATPNNSSAKQLHSLTITDGLGKIIQVKKQHAMGNNATLVWQISGKEVKDPMQRTIESYLPTTEPYNLSTTNYSPNINNSIPPTYTTFDVKNRLLSIRKPGESSTANYSYTIDDNQAVTTFTNELGQIQTTYTDIKGRTTKSIHNQLTTSFTYNPVNDLIQVQNAQGYLTKYKYDLAGRRTKEVHPDRGVSLYTYNTIGKLISKQTAKLLQQGQSINYTYNYHRLTHINYPQNPEKNVAYIYGDSGNNTGRITHQKDASGIQWFSYGNMGELTQVKRAIAVAGRTSYWFTTQWEYDAWNKIQQITYPDGEQVSYIYDAVGQLKQIQSNMPTAGNTQILSNIVYNQYGERVSITYGNGTTTTYNYDNRRRLNNFNLQLPNNGPLFARQYTYDILSNITKIETLNNSSITSPQTSQLAGPTQHNYSYDTYNRLINANGYYVGPNDNSNQLLRQEYNLQMQYDNAHNIIKKQQKHIQGPVQGHNYTIGYPEQNMPGYYTLDYTDYAKASYTADGEGYAQPHTPRKITETPTANASKQKTHFIEYDANGNLQSLKEHITDLEQPAGNKKQKTREYLWDEDDQLRAVDLLPEAKPDHPLIATYTYDAQGQRIIKYIPERTDAFYSAKQTGSKDQIESILYPSPLLTVKTKPIKHPDPNILQQMTLTTYTKHYYMGSQRISSAIGEYKSLGLLCEQNFWADWETILEVNTKVQNAQQAINKTYNFFNKETNIPLPFLYQNYLRCNPSNFRNADAYWYHPDHLGSSTYITNLAGDISQHMEYLPFGETLVEEHLNSYNSPYKFNAKELDEETGNYYYGARYYNPKWSMWLTVDPLAEKFPSWSPYNYTLQNPIVFIDPDGRAAIPFGDYFNSKGKYLGSDGIDDGKVYISQGNKRNFLTASNQEIPGGLASLGGIRTSLTLTNNPSSHRYSPDTKGGLHEVRVDIDLDGVTSFTSGGKVTVDPATNVASGEVNAFDVMMSGVDTSKSDIVGHSHPTKTIVEGGNSYTFDALSPSNADKADFKNRDINFISGNIESNPVTKNPDGTFNIPNNKQGAVFYNRQGTQGLKINIKTINNILSNYEMGKLKN
ncbi:MAG: SpvB/TcaC N-terminal domain-containing protein [Mesonia hippocampi]